MSKGATCTKRVYLTREAAEEAIVKTLANDSSKKKGVLHPYPCEVDGPTHWHIGHHKSPGKKWLSTGS